MNKKSSTVLITGSTRGLGLAYARHLSKSGYDIALTDIGEKACQVYNELESVGDLITELERNGSKVGFQTCDLTNLDETLQMVDSFLSEFDSIDGLVANAGGDVKGHDRRASGGKPENNSFFIEYDDHETIFRRNYYSCLHTLRAVIPVMINQGKGKVVTVASVSAGHGVISETVYSTAKAAIIHLTRSVAAEVRDKGINVNCIAPGASTSGRFLATLNDRGESDLQRLEASSTLESPARPEDVAPVVEFLLSSASDFISGQVIRIDGGQFTSPI